MLKVEPAVLDKLSALLLEKAGLKIPSEGYHSLRLALSARMPALGIEEPAEYVKRLREAKGDQELRALLPLVTVGKTEFFRDTRQFNALERTILPELLGRARREGRRLSIWSAGCATGEEPYSIAMVLQTLRVRPDEVFLWATDVNPAAVETARQGRYPRRRMNGVGPDLLGRFFTPTGEGFEVVPSLKEYVLFDVQNLAAAYFPKVGPASLDLILCRNVIIYFDLPTIRGLMDRFLTGLKTHGYLLLGYSESLFKVYDKFDLTELEGSFVYQPKTSVPRIPAGVSPPAPAPASDLLWFGPQFRALAEGGVPVPAAPPKSPGLPGEALRAPADAVEPPRAPATVESPSLQARKDRALRLVDTGSFEEASAELARLVADEPNDLDVLLTLGNLHALRGLVREARELFEQVLVKEPLCVEARIYGAMAALQAGQLEDARGELRKAIFLEPNVAIAYYLLAQVQERLGNRDEARRSYRNALAQAKLPQRPLAGFYPDMLIAPDLLMRATRYALAALEERVP